MDLIGALLIAIAMGLLLTENLGYGHIQISRPVFAGPIIGLLMGDLQTGLIVGGTVELMFLGVFPVGGSVPPNAQFAGMMATVLAIAAGGKPEIGITLAFPIGVFAQLVLLFDYYLNLGVLHRADAEVASGNVDAVKKYQFLAISIMFLTWTFSSFLGIYLGSEVVGNFYASLPVWFSTGLSAAGGLMPAIGMAMLLKMMNVKKYWSLLLIGYVLSTFLNMNILSMALLTTAVLVAILTLSKKSRSESVSETTPGSTPSEFSKAFTKDDFKAMNLRSFFIGGSLNYERYLGLGFAYAMLPILKKLYTGDELREAVQRHMEFYNTHPWMHNVILGMVTALEEQRSTTKSVSTEAISATKAALMGPTAGFGDSFFKGVIVTITGAFAASLAIDGNPAAPLVFIIPNLIVMLLVRWYGLKWGYQYGSSLIYKLNETNVIETFTTAATIVGMIVTAGLITNYVKFPLAVTFTWGGTELVLDTLLNSILPKFLPYLVTFFYYWIITKNPKRGLYICIALSFAIGIFGKWAGIL